MDAANFLMKLAESGVDDRQRMMTTLAGAQVQVQFQFGGNKERKHAPAL